jgi:hypothetical protein
MFSHHSWITALQQSTYNSKKKIMAFIYNWVQQHFKQSYKCMYTKIIKTKIKFMIKLYKTTSWKYIFYSIDTVILLSTFQKTDKQFWT